VQAFYEAPSNDRGVQLEERVVTTNGTFKFKTKAYYDSYKHAGEMVKVQVSATGKEVLLYAGDIYAIESGIN
jgi:hypothetical protein